MTRVRMLLLVLLSTSALAWHSGTACPPPTWLVRCWTSGVWSPLRSDPHWRERTHEDFICGDLDCTLDACVGHITRFATRTYPLDRCLPLRVTYPTPGQPLPLDGNPVGWLMPGWEGQ